VNCGVSGVGAFLARAPESLYIRLMISRSQAIATSVATLPASFPLAGLLLLRVRAR
jgi:hypothetical protein